MTPEEVARQHQIIPHQSADTVTMRRDALDGLIEAHRAANARAEQAERERDRLREVGAQLVVEVRRAIERMDTWAPNWEFAPGGTARNILMYALAAATPALLPEGGRGEER